MNINPQENVAEIDFSAPASTDLADSLFFEKQNPQAIGEKFIVFFLNDELFAVSAAEVAEVVNLPVVTPLPRVPEWLLGIANLRGEIITVVDLARLWNKKSSIPAAKPKLILLRARSSNAAIAFKADKLSEIIHLPKDKIHLVEKSSTFIFGKSFHKAEVLNLIDTNELVSSLEFNE
ncbi:MAG TPA: chemotaxis protein CheW [Pyrinomonadaceae bacterium]|jgi:purine-binding chemotaxis protein CheW